MVQQSSRWLYLCIAIVAFFSLLFSLAPGRRSLAASSTAHSDASTDGKDFPANAPTAAYERYSFTSWRPKNSSRKGSDFPAVSCRRWSPPWPSQKHAEKKIENSPAETDYVAPVTVVIASCSKPQAAWEAATSALRQTLPVLEVLLVIDDAHGCDPGPTERHFRSRPPVWTASRLKIVQTSESPEAVKRARLDQEKAEHEGRRLGTGRHKLHPSAAIARNVGVEFSDARSEWFAFLDDDDVFLPRKIEWQLRALEEEELLLCAAESCQPRSGHGRCRESWDLDMQANNKTEFERRFQPRGTGLYWDVISRRHASKSHGVSHALDNLDHEFPRIISLKFLKQHNVFILSMVLMSRDLLERSCLFNTNLPNGHEDYSLWRRMLAKTPAVWINECVGIYDSSDHGRCSEVEGH